MTIETATIILTFMCTFGKDIRELRMRFAFSEDAVNFIYENPSNCELTKIELTEIEK